MAGRGGGERRVRLDGGDQVGDSLPQRRADGDGGAGYRGAAAIIENIGLAVDDDGGVVRRLGDELKLPRRAEDVPVGVI
jgi:hypothetical protein